MAKWAGYAKGPLFEDPGDNLTRAANRALTDIAVMGAVRVKQQLVKGHGRVSANLRDHVGGSLVKNLHAQIDAGEVQLGANIVYATWVEGTSSRNPQTVFSGYHMFRNVKDWLSKGPSEVDELFEQALLEVFK